MSLSADTLLAERLYRQRLSQPLQHRKGYHNLFQLLQPVSTLASARPGAPPRLSHRTGFEDAPLADRLRARREIVKGRFLGGNLGYVLADDLELYANAFQAPLPTLSYTQDLVLSALQTVGPLTPRQLKEETGLLNKEIMPALHRLQCAFMVYEDQISDDWERSWYIMADEWPDIRLDPARQPDAIRRVLLRFLQSHVFATAEQLKDWSQLAVRSIKQATADLETAGEIVRRQVPGLGEGWLCAADDSLPERPLQPATWMLHNADPLVRSHRSELKRRFSGPEILQYLLVDGRFQGAVAGHWRIGPHDVDDIVLTLPAGESARRQAEIVTAVAKVYHPPHSHIQRYMGQPLAAT